MKFFLFLLLSSMVFANTFRPLTVLMDFPDYSYSSITKKEGRLIHNIEGYDFDKKLYSDIFFAPDTFQTSSGGEKLSARSFLTLESGGTFKLEGDESHIYGWFTALKSSHYYGKNMPQNGDRIRSSDLVKEAVDHLIDLRIDFSQYDLDDDGIIDGIIIIFAGVGEQFNNSLGSKAIWPHHNAFSVISKGAYYYFRDLDGRIWGVNNYAMLPQDIPINLYLHEMGHLLGLPDLYGQDLSVGFWSNMGDPYCGNISGDTPSSFGGVMRALLQDSNPSGAWAKLEEYDVEALTSPLRTKLYASTLKDSLNLIKINLNPYPSPDSSVEMAFSRNPLISGSTFQFKKDSLRAGSTSLSFDLWFTSSSRISNIRVYARSSSKNPWVLLKCHSSQDRLNGQKWYTLEFDLSSFVGETLEVRGFILPDKKGSRGVYLSNITIKNETLTSHIPLDDISFKGFTKTTDKKTADRYLLIEYRNPEFGILDAGLLTTPYGFTHLKGVLIWIVDESGDSPFATLLSIEASPSVYEVHDGKILPLKEPSYILSGSGFSSIGTPEEAIERNGRYFYRTPRSGSWQIDVLKYLSLEILLEEESSITLSIVRLKTS